MKSREAHDLADDQVVDAIANARQNLFNLRFQHATGQLEDTAALSRAKRDLARVLTEARERGIDDARELRRQAANA